MKNSIPELPEHYREYATVDLQKDKKLALIVNGIAALVTFVMIIVGSLINPLMTLVDVEDLIGTFLRLGCILAAVIGYIILHELTHAAAMKYYGVQKVKFGFTGLYAFAGCDEYIRKTPYLVVALAPIVVWGVILLILNLLVPPAWFWVVYFVQIMNISGAAGDMYVTWRFARLPEDSYVRDIGVSMTVYVKG